MRDILFEYLRQQKKVIIYGAGRNGTFLKWIFEKHDVKIDYYCDGNEKLWNQKVNGIECVSPTKLPEHQDAAIIISILNDTVVQERLEPYSFAKILTWNDVKFLQENLYQNKEEAKEYSNILINSISGLKEKLDVNKKFKDIHKEKRCFIIGNGPSVREQNLALLRDEITFTVNQMARSPQFADVNTNYHLWADPNFFCTDMTCEGDYKLLEVMKCLPPNVESFFPYWSAHDYIEKFELDKYIHVNYYASSGLVHEEEEIDLTHTIRDGYTVVQYAIRLAIYMGFKQIYLLGCECTTILNVINARLSEYKSVTHCYEIDEKEKERAKKMYNGLPMRDFYRAEWGVMDEYHLLHEYCAKREIELVNCTPGGLLNELKRKKMEDVLV